MKILTRSLAAIVIVGCGAFLGWRVQFGQAWFAGPLTSIPVATHPIVTQPITGRLPPPPSPATVSATPTVPLGSTAGGSAAQQLVVQIEAALSARTDAAWEGVLHGLFPALIAADRVAAARLVASFPPGDQREQLLRSLAREWAAVDFAGAVGWISTLTESDERKAAFETACFKVSETDPAEAIRAWEGLAFTAEEHVLANLVQSWAAKDLEAARAWVSVRPASQARDQAVARIAYVMAQSKPAEASAFVMRELLPGPAQTEAMISVLHQWALRDQPAATAWAASFSDDALRERAINELVGAGQN